MNIIKVKDIFIHGFESTNKEKKLVLLYWATRFLFTLPISIIFFLWWDSSFAGNTIVDEILHGFDFNLLQDIVDAKDQEMTSLFKSLIITTIVLVIIVNSFLSGGFIGILSNLTAKNTTHTSHFSLRFLTYAGQYFWKNIHLICFSIILSFAISKGFYALTSYLVSPLKDSFHLYAKFIHDFSPTLLFAISIIFIYYLVQDFARIILVVENQNALIALQKSVFFIFNNLRSILKMFAILLGINFLVIYIIFILQTFIPGYTYFFMFISFLLGQFSFLFNSYFRVTLLASFIELYKKRVS